MHEAPFVSYSQCVRKQTNYHNDVILGRSVSRVTTEGDDATLRLPPEENNGLESSLYLLPRSTFMYPGKFS